LTAGEGWEKVRARPDHLLDDCARAWLSEYVQRAERAAGCDPSPEQTAQRAASTTTIGRRLSSLRVAYLGDVLLKLEAGGHPVAVACRHAPWIARGAPHPRPPLEPLTSNKRRHAVKARRALEAELRRAGLQPESEPEPPSQAQREAFARREQEGRRRQEERVADRPPRVEVELGYEDFTRPLTVAGVVNLILAGEPVLPSHARLEHELRAALHRLDELAPTEYRALLRWTRGEWPLDAEALRCLVTCTPAAMRAGERVAGTLLHRKVELCETGSPDDARLGPLMPLDPAKAGRPAVAPIRWAA